MLLEQLYRRKEKLCVSAAADGVVGGLIRQKIVDRLHLFPKLSTAVLFAMQLLWLTMRERGFAKWSEIQNPTLA